MSKKRPFRHSAAMRMTGNPDTLERLQRALTPGGPCERLHWQEFNHAKVVAPPTNLYVWHETLLPLFRPDPYAWHLPHIPQPWPYSRSMRGQFAIDKALWTAQHPPWYDPRTVEEIPYALNR